MFYSFSRLLLFVCLGVGLHAKSINITINSSYDDVEEHSNGRISAGSSDLEMVTERDHQIVGLRFNNVQIPKGARITDAWIQFKVDEATTTYTRLNITTQDSTSPSSFRKRYHNLSQRATLPAEVVWQVPQWSRVGERGYKQRTPSLVRIIQPLVNKQNWHSGNSMVFLINGVGKRVAESYNGDRRGAPMLHIEYDENNYGSDEDKVAPNIQVVGANPQYLNVGESYYDRGVKAVDNVDGDISYKVKKSINVNSSRAGTYKVYYSVTDSSGNRATATRVVVVKRDGSGGSGAGAVKKSINITINSSYDDVEEHSNGRISAGSSDLEMVTERDHQIVGLRFNNVQIPKGARITDAWIQFKVDEATTTYTRLNITTQDSTSPSSFRKRYHNLSQRATLPAEVVWQVPQWSRVGERGYKQRTPSLVRIIQPLVNKQNWHSGNSMVFLINGVGKRVAESYNGDRRGAPMLHIEYDENNYGSDEDKVAPNIQVVGANPQYLNVGESYYDRGVKAVDNVDGDISYKVKKSINVNSSRAGTYKVYYSVTDSSGNRATATRVVVVKRDGSGGSGAGAVKIAIIGDQSHSDNAKKLLQMIKNEGAELLIINGDFNYGSDIDRWQEMHDSILGTNFPIVAVAGNHDLHYWDQYESIIQEWESRGGLHCYGDTGIETTCNYKGITIVSTPPGIFPGNNHNGKHYDPVGYINSAFQNSNSVWKICSWHKNMTDMQTGHKGNETGWGVYEACRKNGAIVTTGHEHAYARTYLLSSMQNKSIVTKSSTMTIKKGQSIVILSGMGGVAPRTLRHDGYWFASKFNANNGASAGAVICNFETASKPAVAKCYFKDIKKGIIDRFTLISQ